MNITHDYWFSGMAGLVGIVVGEDEITGEIKAYIGVALGIDQESDAKYVNQGGTKLTLRTLDEIRGHLAPKKKPAVPPGAATERGFAPF